MNYNINKIFNAEMLKNRDYLPGNVIFGDLWTGENLLGGRRHFCLSNWSRVQLRRELR